MNKSSNITNENYLEAKNHVSYSPIKFQENIITEPSVPPNGFIIKMNKEMNKEMNNNIINNNTIKNPINNNEINENEINFSEEVIQNNNQLNNVSPSETDNNDTHNNKINNDTHNNETHNNYTHNNETPNNETDTNNLNIENVPSESNTDSYVTELIDNVAQATHNKRNDLIKKEINRIKNMSVENRAKLQVRNEIMQIFPLSIIIALIIFILLLIYIIGFRE